VVETDLCCNIFLQKIKIDFLTDPKPEDRIGQDADAAEIQQREQDERRRRVGGEYRRRGRRRFLKKYIIIIIPI